MNDALKWFFKVLLHAVLWVFVFSIKIDGRPVFTYANEVLVQNALVRTVDDELGDLWYRLSKTAKTTFTKSNQPDDKAM